MMTDDHYEEPPEIETSIDCPVCGKKLFLIYYTTEIPYEGVITINTYVCHECKYRNANVFREQDDRKQKIVFIVTDPDDLNVTVYRSPQASIAIPEISAEILPGDDAKGSITTVEGVLRTIEEQLDMFETNEGKTEKIESIRKFLSGIGSKEFRVTLIIEDDSGKSRIHSPKAKITEG